MGRPFYTQYAWAYDLLIDRPVERECAAIATWFTERLVLPGSTVLDAGCGTGRYAAELTRRGYIVHGIDAAPEMIEQAMQRLPVQPAPLSFSVARLPFASDTTYDAILCRGVLNDILDPALRMEMFPAFARCLRRGGVLLFDVREWEATVERKTREPLFRKRVDTDKGRLTFTSVTGLDHDAHQLHITEQHVLSIDGNDTAADYEFSMQCWTRDEVLTWLRDAGFGAVNLFGAYGGNIAAGASDRLVVLATLNEA